MDDAYGSHHVNANPERRKFQRISGSYIVSYAPLKSEEARFDVSQTRNLSEGGLLLITDRKFDKDTILKIKLRLPEFRDYVIAQAQVVDSVQRVKGVINETRVRFIDLDQKIKDAIKRLVDREH